MNYVHIFILLTAIPLGSCSTNETTSESTQIKTETKTEPIDQIEFIREKYALIESKMEANPSSIIELITKTETGSITYKRAMDGENIIYAYSSDCDDHGCSKSSYYFWDNKLIFKFDQSSSWVGQSDKITEKRTYYLDETEILCLERSKTGSGGYNAINQLLSKVPQDTLQCNNIFDRSTIKEILELTNDEINALAIVKKVEEGQYPMFRMTFYFIDRDETESIYVNKETIMFNDLPLSQLVDRTVTVSSLNTQVTKMQALYGASDVVGEIDPEWKMLKGVVKNIEGGSVGDLPDQVTVEAENGTSLVFDYYIDSAMKALSNKPVTIYYTTKESKEVTGLQLMEEKVETDTQSLAVNRNWIYAENEKFIIKVDELSDGTIRYSSWSKPKEITETPDLTLTDGEVIRNGTGGGYDYIFKNNYWTYKVLDIWMAEQDEGMGIFLSLHENGEQKLRTKLSDLKVIETMEETTKGSSHYICYTDDSKSDLYIWIRFSGGKAKEIKYKGMETSIDLEFDKESENLNPGGPYPVFANYYNEIVDGKVNGVYKLTHSGNYDYAEYVRAKDNKTYNFTIDHSANPYGSTPCF